MLISLGRFSLKTLALISLSFFFFWDEAANPAGAVTPCSPEPAHQSGSTPFASHKERTPALVYWCFWFLFESSYPRGEEQSPGLRTTTSAWHSPARTETSCVNAAKSRQFSVWVAPQGARVRLRCRAGRYPQRVCIRGYGHARGSGLGQCQTPRKEGISAGCL